MKIMVDVGHPAHVHLFKNAIWILQQRGHQVKITAREKDVTTQLLEAYGFEYENMGKLKNGFFRKLQGVLKNDYIMLKVAKKFQPDLLLSAGSPYSTHISAMIRKPSIVLEDTEHSLEQYLLYAPFASVILTPQCFRLNLGKKQVRYNGYHELAYLHPNRFRPDPRVLDELDIIKDEHYVIVRFVSWAASHDIGQTGFSTEEKTKLIREIEEYAIPMITSEGQLPKELQKYQIRIPPHWIHDVMYYANMYIGEGGTMASEAAVMGTPSILVNPQAKYCGTHKDLTENYKIQIFFDSISEIHETVMELLENKNTKQLWKERRERMINEKIDVTEYIIDLLEKYGSD